MKYLSSRGKEKEISAAQTIVQGIAIDGGLFVPESIPTLQSIEWEELGKKSYQEKAALIFAKFLSEFNEEEINKCVTGAYNATSFDDPAIAPLVKIKPDLYVEELWHGPTAAFKDMALQILPRFLTVSAQKTGATREIVILVATSGDTGKAALEGFKDVAGTKIIVFFPVAGVSEVQKQQMITQTGNNVFVASVEGNFDDAQNGVKKIFTDQAVAEKMALANMQLSSANSINWGRLLPQIVYYIAACADLKARGDIKADEKINFVVPTGNFGNILAAYYAKQMGAPINKLICASNANNVLTDFIHSGCYNRNRKFEKTISPSMDILISSNLERLLFELTAHDSSRVAQWMEDLKNKGQYSVDEETKKQIHELFWAAHADDEETMASIASVWQQDKYLLDTHTAVAYNVYQKYIQATQDNTKTVIVSTASPFKFAGSVARAIMGAENLADKNEYEILENLSQYTGAPIPAGLQNLNQRPVLHNTVSSKDEMQAVMYKYLGI